MSPTPKRPNWNSLQKLQDNTDRWPMNERAYDSRAEEELRKIIETLDSGGFDIEAQKPRQQRRNRRQYFVQYCEARGADESHERVAEQLAQRGRELGLRWWRQECALEPDHILRDKVLGGKSYRRIVEERKMTLHEVRTTIAQQAASLREKFSDYDNKRDSLARFIREQCEEDVVQVEQILECAIHFFETTLERFARLRG